MTFKAQDVSRGGSCTHPAVPALLTHIYTRMGLPDTPARCLMNPSWPGVQVQVAPLALINNLRTQAAPGHVTFIEILV